MSANPLHIALVGNPNSGKTSLFNALTGLRQRVGNFPGVTVDRKSGQFSLASGRRVKLVDLPGTYNIYPEAGDEAVVADVLLDQNHADHPEAVVFVADVTNLRRSLLLCTQVMDLGLPVILALNMTDLLQEAGVTLDIPALEAELGIPIVKVSALKGTGLDDFRKALEKEIVPAKDSFFSIPDSFNNILKPVAEAHPTESRYRHWLRTLRSDLFSSADGSTEPSHPDPEPLITNELALRYDKIADLLERCQVEAPSRLAAFTARLDSVLLSPIEGYIIFLALLFLIFQSVFAFATYPMDLIDGFMTGSGEWMAEVLPESIVTSIFLDGIWAGLGAIVIFVPQIAILFFFISVLEDSGYMSRAVFLMDRIMRPFGFSGKSVIPLIGGMACAIPSIMMARGISNKTERFITIMVTPLMSCSARIPVYVVLIGLLMPENEYIGIFNVQGLIMTGMYLLGFVMALIVALVIKLMARYKSDGIFVSELPVYRTPRWKNIGLVMYRKSATFVWEAGKVIMVISVVLWFLQSYGPGDEMEKIEANFTAQIDAAKASNDTLAIPGLQTKMQYELVEASYAGHLGKFIEPVIRPLGFDWKIGISLVTSFAAREVFVGTMGVLYNAGPGADEDEEGRYEALRRKMAEAVDPETGERIYTPAVLIALLVFYAFAMQCMSTLAVVRKETGSWKMTLIMLGYLTGLAYGSAFIAYQLFS
ncbi:MAG: ferrous iron transport protein B [Bacteroidota bacterium]